MDVSYNNAMKRQVFSLPELLRQQYLDLESKVRQLFSKAELLSVRKIILTGCGDSHAAALAVYSMFEELCAVPTTFVSAIDLARLYNPVNFEQPPMRTLVIAISNSGQVSRVREAIKRSNEFGCLTLGITSDASSPVGLACEKLLLIDMLPFESSPGIRSYLTSVLALQLVAIRISEVLRDDTKDVAISIRNDLLRQADVLEEWLPGMNSQILNVALDWQSLECFDFIGSGIDYAAAFYGRAKMFEAPGCCAMISDSEEFLHLNFFARRRLDIGTILLASSLNPCKSRNMEVLEYLILLERPLLVISDDQNIVSNEESVFLLQVPRSTYAYSLPLIQFTPLALLAGYLTELHQECYGRGLRHPWTFAEGGKAIRESTSLY